MKTNKHFERPVTILCAALACLLMSCGGPEYFSAFSLMPCPAVTPPVPEHRAHYAALETVSDNGFNLEEKMTSFRGHYNFSFKGSWASAVLGGLLYTGEYSVMQVLPTGGRSFSGIGGVADVNLFLGGRRAVKFGAGVHSMAALEFGSYARIAHPAFPILYWIYPFRDPDSASTNVPLLLDAKGVPYLFCQFDFAKECALGLQLEAGGLPPTIQWDMTVAVKRIGVWCSAEKWVLKKDHVWGYGTGVSCRF